MNVERWERICRKNGVVPMSKIKTKHGDVYVAEGIRDAKPNSPYEGEQTSHFLMVWAMSRDKLDIGKSMAVSAVHYPFQKERLQIVMRDVDEWVKDNVENGRYAA